MSAIQTKMCQLLVQGFRGADLRKQMKKDWYDYHVDVAIAEGKKIGVVPKRKDDHLPAVTYLVACTSRSPAMSLVDYDHPVSPILAAARLGDPLPRPERMATPEEVAATRKHLLEYECLRYGDFMFIPMDAFWLVLAHLFPGAGYIPNEQVSEEGVLIRGGLIVGLDMGRGKLNDSSFVVLKEP